MSVLADSLPTCARKEEILDTGTENTIELHI